MDTTPEITLQVAQVQTLHPLIKSYVLQRPDGAPLPPWTAGAHLQVAVPSASAMPPAPASTQWRHYSLIDLDEPGAQPDSPSCYRIAVRLEEAGRGGSAYLHRQLQPGQALQVRAPANDFALAPDPPRARLLAGGIGITPLMSMATALRRAGAHYELHYAARHRDQLAFAAELQAQHAARLHLHPDNEPERALNLADWVAECRADDHLYLCGPPGLLDAALALCERRGLARGQVHFERFAVAPQQGDGGFELVLSHSGRRLTVPADKTILQVLIDSGCDPMYDCQRGECGVCTTTVIEGEIDHRDHYLSERERASGQLMQTCVSRCRGSRLVLDL